MSFYTQNEDNQLNDVLDCVQSLNTSIATQGSAFLSEQSSLQFLSGESIEDDTVNSVKAAIQTSGLSDIMMKRVGTDNPEDPMVSRALQSAAFALMAAGNPEQYHNNSITSKAIDGNKGVELINQEIPGISSLADISGESFDNQDPGKFLAVSVVIAALSSSINSFEETFYPTTTLSAGRTGVDIQIRTPYAWALKARNSDGTAYKERDSRRSLVQSLRDNSILRGQSTKVFANADVVANEKLLVDPAYVPNRQVEAGSVTYNTRPLIFGERIDLLSISTVKDLHGTGAQNQTDTLANAANLGKVYVTLVGTAQGNETYGIDVSTMMGSNFTPSAEGDITGRTLNFRGVVQVRDDMKTELGAAAGSVTAVRTLAGLQADDAFTMLVEIEISATIDEAGNIKANANGAEIIDVKDNNGTSISASALTAVKTDVSAQLRGYQPEVSRSNSNLRNRGTLIDAGTPRVYRVEVHPNEPITAICPRGEGKNSVDFTELANIKRVTQANRAIITTLAFEEILKRTRDLPSSTLAVGAELVTPTYITGNLDAASNIRIFNSTNGLSDLRTGITNALSTMADQLANESGYLSALELETGSSDKYEIILGTDPHLANLIMTSGDARTIGAANKFVVAKTHDTEMAGKIYLSFRRTDVTGPNALSWGFHAEVPALVYNTNIHDSGANFVELQMIPRSKHAVTCPVLGVLHVNGLDKVFYERS